MKTSFTILIILATLFSSCIKEGPRGPEGFPGEDGKNGLNATGSELFYFDIKINEYKRELYINDNTQFYNDTWVAYGFIDGRTIQKTDLVMVYMHQTTDGGSDNYFQALPYLDYTDNSSSFIQYTYGIMDDNGDLVFGIRKDDGSAPFINMNDTWTIQYNVYIVKGSQNRNAEIPSSVNLEDEEALKSYLKISKGKKSNFIFR